MKEVLPINPTNGTPRNAQVTAALSAENASIRLRAAMAAGSTPDPGFLEPLVERCAVEPDFFVRDTLSWALARLSPEITLPRLRQELASDRPQARSQALHTLSKIGDKSAWAWITWSMLRDSDDEFARTAWRVAVALVPEDERESLVDELVMQLGRGDRHVRLSLTRALVSLGDLTVPALTKAATHPDPAVATHARATELLRLNPATDFDAAVAEARRVVARGPDRATAAVAAPPAAGTVAMTGARETDEPAPPAGPDGAAVDADAAEPRENTER
ncbi:HEAT repeat domain-containing protein [Streptomyces sp. NPDC016309]|uniref:HEAT repeat domain-containing protein n=1 Tax=Streptomyces sp. NPDC016309 TaxID=3364965 RepID=UPI0036F875F6